MATAFNVSAHRPREWRRRVNMPARVQHGGAWTQGHILNLSSRGMLLRYARPLGVGTTIQVRQGAHAVVATVVWQRRGQAGLQCRSAIGIIDWLESGGIEGALSVVDRVAPTKEHTGVSRTAEQSREIGRRIEFAAIATAAVIAAGSMAFAVATTLVQPLRTVMEVLDR